MSQESMRAALSQERAGRRVMPARPAPESVESEGEAARPPSRRGKKAVVCYVDPAVARQLKVLCAQEDKTLQGVVAEALNALLEDRGLLPLA